MMSSLFFRTICGLTQFTTKAHIARAALEAVCFQTREVSLFDFTRVSYIHLYVCASLICMQ